LGQTQLAFVIYIVHEVVD